MRGVTDALAAKQCQLEDTNVKSKMHAPARDSDVVERLASIKANLNRLRSTRE